MTKIVGLHYNVQCTYAGWNPICKVDLGFLAPASRTIPLLESGRFEGLVAEPVLTPTPLYTTKGFRFLFFSTLPRIDPFPKPSPTKNPWPKPPPQMIPIQ